MKRLILIAILLGSSGVAVFGQTTGQGRLISRLRHMDDSPISGAQMVFTMEETPDGKTNTQYRKDTESMDSGEFSMNGMLSGLTKITISKDGYHSRIFFYRQTQATVKGFTIYMLKKGETIENFPEAPKMKGRVVDSKGKPLGGVSIKLYSDDLIAGMDVKDEQFAGLFRTTKTNPNGGFEVEGFKFCTVAIYCSLEEYNDQIYKEFMSEKDLKPKIEMLTIPEAYIKAGLEPPKKRVITPEEQAVDMYNSAVDPYQEGNFARAEELALAAHKLDPKQVGALKMLVFSNHKLDDWEGVFEYATKMLKITPKDENMINYVMEAARLTDRTEVFEEKKEAVRQIKGITPESLYSEAVDAINQQNDPLAVQRLGECLKMNDQHYMAYYQLGMITIREGDYDAAVKKLKYYLKYAPKDHKDRKEITDLVISLSE